MVVIEDVSERRILVTDMYVYIFSSLLFFFLSFFLSFSFLSPSKPQSSFQRDAMITLISRTKNSCSRLGKLMSYTHLTDRRVAQLGRVLFSSPLGTTLWVVRGV
jgi:hypothetical protein